MRVRSLLQGAAAAAAVLGASSAWASVPDAPGDQLPAEAYCERKLGHWFYCERPKPAEKAEAKPEEAEADPEKQLAEFQKELDRAKAIAVWEPTEANIRRYYEMQQVALERAGMFTDNWRRMIWTSPELDYTMKRPVSTLGKRVWEDDRETDRDIFLRGAAEKVGLFYVFRGDCSACKVASPIVKNFSVRYGVPVTAVSGDGAGNPLFTKVVADRGQLEAWGVGKITPALLFYQEPDKIVNGRPVPTTVRVPSGATLKLRPCNQPKGCLTYVGAGIMSVEDIAERLFVLLALEPGKDF